MTMFPKMRRATDKNLTMTAKGLAGMAGEIIDLKARAEKAESDRDEAKAREAVLVEALMKAAIRFRRISERFKYHRENDLADIAGDYSIACDMAISGLPTQTTAHLERLRALEANQRTPGTVEVCSHCKSHIHDALKRLAANHCPDFCPIR